MRNSSTNPVRYLLFLGCLRCSCKPMFIRPFIDAERGKSLSFFFDSVHCVTAWTTTVIDHEKNTVYNLPHCVCYESAGQSGHQANINSVSDAMGKYCTIIIYYRALQEGLKHQFRPVDDDTLRALKAIRDQTPARKSYLKVLLSVSLPLATLRALASSDMAMRSFVKTYVDYVRGRDIDGLELSDRDHPLTAAHRGDFSTLITILQAEFEREGKRNRSPHLMLAVSVSATSVSAYDGLALSVADIINVRTEDLYPLAGWSLNVTVHHSPLYASEIDGYPKGKSYSSVMDRWTRSDVAKDQLNVGIGLFGRMWHLNSTTHHTLGAPAVQAGHISRATLTGLCGSGRFHSTRTKTGRVPYMYAGEFWIAYEDKKSIIDKVEWINDNEFGGATIWEMEDAERVDGCDSVEEILAAVSMRLAYSEDSVVVS